jgi:hypothetical protein
MGRTCSTNGGDEEVISDIGGKAIRKETTRKTQHIGTWIILTWILARYDGMICTGLIWLRIGASDGLL